MFRKAIIVMLTLAAVGTAVAFALTFEYWFGYMDSTSEVFFMDGMLGIAFGIGISYYDMNGWFVSLRDIPGFTPFRLYWLPIFMSRPGGGGIAIPLWMFFFLFAVYPMLAFIRGPLRRYRRRKRGLCLRCGYNLEGNVSGVCPECGEAT